jgi:hypothetical protein
VIYVGHQQDRCGKNSLSRQKGLEHGADTIAKCTVEGFPSGRIVFLDVESFNGPLSANTEGYIRGWISALLDSAGALSPGIYCPKKSANEIQRAAGKEYIDHALPNGAPAFWIVKTQDPLFDPSTSSPVDCRVSFANVWQGRIDVKGEVHGAIAKGSPRESSDFMYLPQSTDAPAAASRFCNSVYACDGRSRTKEIQSNAIHNRMPSLGHSDRVYTGWSAEPVSGQRSHRCPVVHHVGAHAARRDRSWFEDEPGIADERFGERDGPR